MPKEYFEKLKLKREMYQLDEIIQEFDVGEK